jgi:hypothetical protein
MLSAIPGAGVEVGARTTSFGAEVEFKLPWKNFANFAPAAGEIIGLDAELCYSDGAARVDRTFAFGSPLSVQQPASLANVQLVEQFRDEHWRPCGPLLLPVRCDTPWGQNERAMVYAQKLLDLEGHEIEAFDGQIATLNEEGQFYRAEAKWSIDLAPPGGYLLVGIAYDAAGNELTRVAPRMVSVGMNQGY